MPCDDLSLVMRNILFVQLMLLATTPEFTLRLRHELVRLWRTLRAPVAVKKAGPAKKSKFWEIDMTKFEP